MERQKQPQIGSDWSCFGHVCNLRGENVKFGRWQLGALMVGNYVLAQCCECGKQASVKMSLFLTGGEISCACKHRSHRRARRATFLEFSKLQASREPICERW